MPGAGALDRRVRIEYATITPGETGEDVETWRELVTVWARRVDESASERFAASQEVAERQSAFVIRYRRGLEAKMRLIEAGLIYDIVGIKELGRREFLELAAVVQGV